MEPDGKWHVHDPARPQPPIVTSGTFSENATPPSDAIVLFDGTDLSQWRDKKDGAPASWTVQDGVATSAKGDIQTTNESSAISNCTSNTANPPRPTAMARAVAIAVCSS